METSIQYTINPNISTSLRPIFLYPTVQTESREHIPTTVCRDVERVLISETAVIPLHLRKQHCSSLCYLIMFLKVMKVINIFLHYMYKSPGGAYMQDLK